MCWQVALVIGLVDPGLHIQLELVSGGGVVALVWAVVEVGLHVPHQHLHFLEFIVEGAVVQQVGIELILEGNQIQSGFVSEIVVHVDCALQQGYFLEWTLHTPIYILHNILLVLLPAISTTYNFHENLRTLQQSETRKGRQLHQTGWECLLEQGKAPGQTRRLMALFGLWIPGMWQILRTEMRSRTQ